MQCKVTPEMFWQFRRAQLGGKSAVTGQELPKTLAECNPAVQADHYAQACYAMAHYELARSAIESLSTLNRSLALVPLPPNVAVEDARRIINDATRQMLVDHGVA